jgi:N4-(beta-N-acetylglucosaminyl)-L-asparaginase
MKGNLSGKAASFAGNAPLLSSRKPAVSAQRRWKKASHPIVLSTWNFGRRITETAYQIISEGGSPIDAVEAGVGIAEANPKITSVGYGGAPDREGKVTLDACIMNGNGDCGAVAFLEHIMHPVSVARLVMEKTPHVMLVGDGALKFALKNGFQKENLLTEEANKAYRKWLKAHRQKTKQIDKDNHDTICMVALDGKGNMAGACSTNGTAYKIRGRVGDSPLIGAGLYVDSDVGAAAATGFGETVIKVSGSFLIVELMRQGVAPQEACKMTIERIIHKQPKYKKVQHFLIGFIALRKDGRIGAMSYRKGFQYSLNTDGKNQVFDAESYVKK